MFDDVVARGVDPEYIRAIIRDGVFRTAATKAEMAAALEKQQAPKN